jgi:hypothetical protein
MNELPIPSSMIQQIRSLSHSGKVYVVGDSHACRQIADVLDADPRIFVPLSGPGDLEGTHEPIVLIAPNWWMGGNWSGMEDVLEKVQAHVHKISYFRASLARAQRQAEDSRRIYTSEDHQALLTSGHSGFKSYRKVPVQIQALGWDGSYKAIQELKKAGAQVSVDKIPRHKDGVYLGLKIWNDQEDQWISCHLGWMVIKGVNGEFYPCSPDVFAKTYRPDGHELEILSDDEEI